MHQNGSMRVVDNSQEKNSAECGENGVMIIREELREERLDDLGLDNGYT